MSNIVVKISGVDGESDLVGYEGQIACQSMRHAIDLPVVSRGSARTEGASRHGAIELAHAFDSASPMLRLAASAGTNLGEAVITRMRMVGGTLNVAEVITLTNTYVVRVDVQTPLDPATSEPAEDPVEVFSLEYSDIHWDYKYYVNGSEVGSVQGGWSTTTLSVI